MLQPIWRRTSSTTRLRKDEIVLGADSTVIERGSCKAALSPSDHYARLPHFFMQPRPKVSLSN